MEHFGRSESSHAKSKPIFSQNYNSACSLKTHTKNLLPADALMHSLQESAKERLFKVKSKTFDIAPRTVQHCARHTIPNSTSTTFLVRLKNQPCCRNYAKYYSLNRSYQHQLPQLLLGLSRLWSTLLPMQSPPYLSPCVKVITSILPCITLFRSSFRRPWS